MKLGDRADQQWARVERYFARFEALSRKGRIHDAASETYVDDVYSFFIQCYHLKDWIAADGTSPLQSAVREFGKRSQAFQVCRDLCLGVKHLNVVRPSSDLNDARLGRKGVEFNVSSGVFTMRVFVRVGSDEQDAFDIAKECMGEWRKFLGIEEA